MEVCSNCGAFVERLNDITGWCLECSPLLCERCQGSRTSDHKFCTSCQRELWLIRNADMIEEYIIAGLTYGNAIRRIQSENRAVCIICTSPIIGRNKAQAIFCTKTKACRRAKGRYNKLIERKGLSKDLALEVILREEAI